MSALYLTIESARRINARTYNNVRLLRMKDAAQRRGCGASIVGDHITVRTKFVEYVDGRLTRTGFKWQAAYNWGQLWEILGDD